MGNIGSGRQVGHHDFLPDRVCKKAGHPTVKRYPNGTMQCLTCQRLARADREKKIRLGTEGPPRQRTKQQMRKTKMVIAALGGAAVHPQVIAKEVALPRDTVEQILRHEVKTDSQLHELFKRAERELAPKAFDTAKKLIEHISNVAEGYDAVVGKDKEGNAITQRIQTPPQHAAVALREMRPFIGMGDRPPVGDPADGVQKALADAMQKPEVAKAVVEAVMAARAKQIARG